ncbi:putative uncharacterized protein [Parachlamydia acanthamoebae UV-7]|uniref:Uncharacterized protein n=2 Tax=Parachlamydia acanthamoebae TaxID=83552 RepID=F8KWA1_PARAV|nr:hypothetical protein pah_c050o057 [Parachlamydia acanthamoebae str. Hall's coccus]CCB86034.1 putative uncharacterized protein [Parachlamydia acanthamoebae UV-7]
MVLNENHLVPIDKIPEYSPGSASIFKKFSNAPEALRHSPLRDRANELAKVTKKWHKTKDNEVKDKIFAIFRTALGITIIAVGVFGLVAGAIIAPPVAGITVSAGVAYACLTGYNMYHAKTPLTFKGILTACALGPFLPIYKAFGNVNRLQKIRISIQDSVELDFDELTRFFNAEHTRIEAKLTEEIARLDKAIYETRVPLLRAEKFKVDSPDPFNSPEMRESRKRERDFWLEKCYHETALKELQDAAAFYAKYK